MSAAALPMILTAQAGSGLLSAYSSRQAGEAQARELKFAKKQEFAAAEEREIARKNRLLDALASQNVQAGMGGVQMTGTPFEIMMQDVKAAEREQESDDLQTKIRGMSLSMQASAAKRMGRTQALATLMSTGADIGTTGFLKDK